MDVAQKSVYDSILNVSDAKDDKNKRIARDPVYCAKLKELITSTPMVADDIIEYVERVGMTDKEAVLWTLIKITLPFDKSQRWLYNKIISIADDNEDAYPMSEDPDTLEAVVLLIARRLPIKDLLKEAIDFDQIDTSHPEWQLLEKKAKTAANYEGVMW
jgi:hypothetical protein